MLLLIPGQTPLSRKQILSEKEYRDSIEKFGHKFKAGMGAEAVKDFWQNLIWKSFQRT